MQKEGTDLTDLTDQNGFTFTKLPISHFQISHSPISTLQTPISKLQTPNSNHQTPDSKLQTPNSKLRSPNLIIHIHFV